MATKTLTMTLTIESDQDDKYLKKLFGDTVMVLDDSLGVHIKKKKVKIETKGKKKGARWEANVTGRGSWSGSGIFTPMFGKPTRQALMDDLSRMFQVHASAINITKFEEAEE